MQEKFTSILEFAKFKKECVFCKTPLRVVLTSFLGIRETGVPIIKSYLKDNKFHFKINHTTATFNINADAVIDAAANVILFSNYTNGELPAIDEYVVRQTFEDYRPHIELYCPSNRCGLMYHLSGDWMRLNKIAKVQGAWTIAPFKLFIEGAKVKNYIIHNDWEDKITSIYSLRNEDSRPIEVPMIDFTTMDKTRLTNRVQTLVIFS